MYDDDTGCIDAHDGSCRGPVGHHAVPGGSAVPRCDRHFDLRLARWEGSIERYADSDVVPDWFDPSYAGERWDDD
jgi:hypothetical protein